MEKRKDPKAVLDEVLDEFLSYLTRFATFREENAEYIEHLNAIGEAQDWKIKPVDPQDIQRGDALIKEVEEAGLEDAVEGYDEMKYKGEIYHQYRAFTAEGRALKRRLTEGQLACV